jgi:hypothetical protein
MDGAEKAKRRMPSKRVVLALGTQDVIEGFVRRTNPSHRKMVYDGRFCVRTQSPVVHAKLIDSNERRKPYTAK